MAAARLRHPVLRRAHARHRRRRQERDLQAAEHTRRAGQGDRDDLVGAARNPAHEPSHPRHVRGPHHRRAVGARRVAGEDHASRHPARHLADGVTTMHNTNRRQKLLAFASLLALMVFFSLASPNFLQTDNLLAILQATAINGVLAIASTFVIISAGIDLSVGTLMTFCSVMAGVFLTYWGLPIYAGIFAAIFFGSLCGFSSGVLIAKLKIPPFIATLGMMMLLK